MPGLLLPIAFLAFAALGLPDGILGVSWPAMREGFRVPLDALGLLLAISTAGYVVSSFWCGWLVARLGLGGLLAASTFLAAASLAAYAASPNFGVLMGAGLAAGLGGGAVDAGLNTYAALRFPPRFINWLHASYSLGALLGPLLMAAVLAHGGLWRGGYALVAAVQAGLGVVFLLTLKAWRTRASTRDSPAGSPVSAPIGYLEALSDSRVWPGIAAFFLYTGLEFSVGQWAYSLLTLGRGLDKARAGLWVGLFFGGFFAGRALAGGLPLGGNLRLILRGAPACLVAAALSAWLGGTGPFAAAGLLLLGLACAPIYPALVAATPLRLGVRLAAHAMGMQVAAATLGIAVLPGLIGILAQRAGAGSIALGWIALSAMAGGALLWAARRL